MSELCELDDLKTQLGIALNDTSSDTQLERLIAAASGDFMMEIKRPDFAPAADYVEWIEHIHQSRSVPTHGSYGYYSRFRSREVTVFLEHYPVNKITKVTLNDTELTALSSPFASGPGYWFDPDLEDEERQKIVLIDCGTGWFNLGPLNQLKVEYNGGYDTIPDLVSQAVTEWAAWRRGLGQLQQLDQSAGSVSAGSVTLTGDNVDMSVAGLTAEIPDNVKRAIAHYKRVVI